MKAKEYKKGTQYSMILNYLRRGWALTPLSALRIAGTFKLSSRTSEMRADGWDIKSCWQELPNGKRVKKYWL